MKRGYDAETGIETGYRTVTRVVLKHPSNKALLVEALDRTVTRVVLKLRLALSSISCMVYRTVTRVVLKRHIRMLLFCNKV